MSLEEARKYKVAKSKTRYGRSSQLTLSHGTRLDAQTAPAFRQMTDAGLLEAAAAGSHAAFRDRQPPFPACLPAGVADDDTADAEDIAQEAFVKLWKQPAQVPGRRAEGLADAGCLQRGDRPQPETPGRRA